MRHTTLFATLGASFCVLAALSCSGGGGGGTGVPSASTTSVTSTGTVTDFGSVYINGRKYEINDATTTTKDDSTVSGDQNAKSVLRRGMVVTVSGTSSGTTRTAATIEHQNTLEGPIQSPPILIDANNGTLIVLGQTVVVDATTKFDDTVPATTFASLSVNDVIEVSGFVKEDTTGVFIVASFIEKKTGVTGCDSICEVKGKITSHTTPLTTTFQIGALTVNYAPPADITDMPNPSQVDWFGLFVEVKGNNVTPGGTLTATKVEPEGFQAPNGNQVELEGYVTGVSGSGQFMIGTTTVQASNAQYLGGTIDEVAVGQKLEVEGSISNNVITATKVKFQDSVRLEGIVSSFDGSTMILDGLPTITITKNSATEVKGTTPVTGHRVKVRGREGATVGIIVNMIATEVEGNGVAGCATCDVDLQGAVQSVSNPLLKILGVQIDTSTSEFDDPADFQGLNDLVIGRAAFFGSVQVGTVVKVKGRLTTGVITWREVELED